MKKILFVAQSKLFAQTLRAVLSADFEIITVKEVDVALLKVVQWHPDLVITGIEIGNITGFDFCLLLKMMPDFASTPTILISSYDDKMTHQKAAAAGADYYVIKDKDTIKNIKTIIANLNRPAPDHPHTQAKKRRINKVLVVDDSLTMRKIIKNILFGLGVKEVTEAINGMEGLLALDKDEYDMVISDWAMPVMNGLEMIKNIRLLPENDELPVVMVSAEAEDALQDALEEGVDAYLRKPFNALNMQELLDQFAT